MYTSHGLAAAAVLLHSVSALPQIFDNVFRRAQYGAIVPTLNPDAGPAPTGYYPGKGPLGTAPIVTAGTGTAPIVTGTGTGTAPPPLGTGTGTVGTGTGVPYQPGATYHYPGGSKPATTVISIPTVVLPTTESIIETAVPYVPFQPSQPTDVPAVPSVPGTPAQPSTETLTSTSTITSTITVEPITSYVTSILTATQTVTSIMTYPVAAQQPAAVQTETQTVTVTVGGACPLPSP